ncbi:sulfiredoxin, chloroplastic/mitochondrial isoform X1 [Sesamum indicum]|uniref:sulfiredoxin n=1 Tax=Sesamum indicum TaxID=4182 RepID=A0A6I9UAW0_SESIN|nr:sulfiredoxin, chloroplastic/mitochondrial isoform X1 [Sesamum indicum]
MANFVLQLPNNFRFRAFSVSASTSSNGSPPSVPQSGGPVVLELPLDKIRRPLMRTRANDPQKVKELMESIREIGLQVPIDVLEVDGEYYGFSGCHRYEAHQRLGLPTIRCKVRRGTKETLRFLRYCSK